METSEIDQRVPSFVGRCKSGIILSLLTTSLEAQEKARTGMCAQYTTGPVRRNIIAVDCEKIFLSIVPSSSRSLQTLLQLVHYKILRSTPPCCLCSFRFGHQMTRLVMRCWAADRIREDIHDGNRLQSRGKLRGSHP
jgi:hypothetical protein